ncbi:hypothetical protein BC628DRAFT_62960 [Trametes gibbosa]|nr:hypothetical protein BC628DRAFT_62960 [Trametes gibbosa]
MALLVTSSSSSSLDALRRSPRISTRRHFSPTSTYNPPPDLARPSPPRHSPRSRPSTASRHRTIPAVSPPLPPRAGTKRKRSTKHSDVPDLPRYKLVLAAPHSVHSSQTPRQLRYAKRQRLLLSSQGINLPLPPLDLLPPPPSSPHEHHQKFPLPPHHPHLDPLLPPQPPSLPVPSVQPDLDDLSGATHGPVFTPFHRTPVYWRQRSPDSTDPTLWKSACQERVEYLKTVYCDIVRAVVNAEIAAAQAQVTAAPPEAPTVPSSPLPVLAQPATNDITTQFEHYDPSQTGAVDADGDADMDAVEDDEEEYDDGEDDAIGEDDVPEALYEQVMVLEPPPPAPARPYRPRLPRLSSIRVSSLEPYPSPTTKDGVSFIGRGTPPDPMRLAEWAAPAPPLPPRASSPQSWTPEPLYFTPDMVPPTPAPASVGFDMDVTANAMSWLDPVLHPHSVSPSPSPVPTSIPGFDSNSVAGGFVFPDLPSPEQPTYSGALATSPPTPLSPTGCALHESFLECLRAPGCAGPGLGAASAAASPFFVPPPVAPAVPELAPAFPAPPAVFPNQELAQFVRSHLVPGSVSLSHALG